MLCVYISGKVIDRTAPDVFKAKLRRDLRDIAQMLARYVLFCELYFVFGAKVSHLRRCADSGGTDTDRGCQILWAIHRLTDDSFVSFVRLPEC